MGVFLHLWSSQNCRSWTSRSALPRRDCRPLGTLAGITSGWWYFTDNSRLHRQYHWNPRLHRRRCSPPPPHHRHLPPLMSKAIFVLPPPHPSLQHCRTLSPLPPPPLNPVFIIHRRHIVALLGTILYHVGKCCLKLHHIWILNDDENWIRHVKFVAFQNAEFALGSLWHNFCHPDDVGKKHHLVQNDCKGSHYNLIMSNGLADLVLIPIRACNRIMRK